MLIRPPALFPSFSLSLLLYHNKFRLYLQHDRAQPHSAISTLQTYCYQSLQPFLQSKMDLLDLPVDLFHKVLLYAVISRGVTRALRLKLVCSGYNSLRSPKHADSD